MCSAVVTGAAGGFGRAISERLRREGVSVFGMDRTASEGIHALDVTDEAQVRAAFQMAERTVGPLRVLVTCAGVMPAGQTPVRIVDTELGEWEDTFAVNARGSFLCLREFLRLREETPVADARVVLMSSAAAQLGGYRGSAAYVSSKAAVLGLTKIAAREAAADGITVNCIAAGPVKTGMFDAATTPESAAALAGRIPLGRIGTAEEVAGMVSYLAGPDAGWVTGATFDINGGYRMQ